MKIIDATDLVLGRLATRVAKLALNGEDVQVINCDKAVVVGSRDNVFARYVRKSEMGVPAKGPFVHRGADRIVRKCIRGMLPYKLPKGRDAFKKVMCYIGVPEGIEGGETFDEANINNTDNIKFVTVKQISEKLGFKY